LKRLERIKCDAVGYEAVGHSGNGHDHKDVLKSAYDPPNPLQVITWITQAARKYSTVGIPGVYGSAYDNRRIDPKLLISHKMKLEVAPKAYEMFNKKEDVTKVIFSP
jgi:S-(hydroxymethyl)glutathione dehydrogenase/alcohol dehydrogenase